MARAIVVKERMCDECGATYLSRYGYRLCQPCRRKNNKDVKRKYKEDYLTSHPCWVCGESDPVILQFHHIDPTTKYRSSSPSNNHRSSYGRSMGISGMVNSPYTLSKLKEEIAKCVVLCANCHLRVEAGTVELPRVQEN